MMIASLPSIVALLSAASLSIAAPFTSDTPQNNVAEITYRQGKAGSQQYATIEIGPKTDPSAPRYGQLSMNSDEPLYDLKVLGGPSDVWCRFRLTPSNLPSWVPGSDRRTVAEETLTWASELAGPVEHVQDVVCQTDSDYVSLSQDRY